MPQLLTLPRETITNTLTVSVAASADTTQRALNQLDLAGPTIGAIRELGLTDRVTLHVGVRVTADHEDCSWLTIVTRFSATDELLDAWPVLRPLAKRAARTVKHHAEEDRFETIGPIEVDAMAA